MSAVPFMVWSVLYYILLLVFYRYVVHAYVTDVLDRQLLGFWDTVSLTAVFAGYLILCAIPPYLWSRKSYYHSLWRGIESFVVYLLLALALGAFFSAFSEDDWSVLSAVSASGDAWARLGSIAALFAVFVGASWRGGKAAANGKRRRKTGKARQRDS